MHCLMRRLLCWMTMFGICVLAHEPTLCKTGKEQSPIALDCTLSTMNLQPLDFAFQAYYITEDNFLRAPGVLQLDYPGDLHSHITSTDGQTRYLQGITFHAPSSHTIQGQHADMEVNFVFTDSKRQEHLGVSVLWKRGRWSGPMQNILRGLGQEPIMRHKQTGLTPIIDSRNNPELVASDDVHFDPASLLPSKADYYTYKGSQMVPPCQPMEWYVMRQTLSLGLEQLQTFHRILQVANNRPVQMMHKRLVRLSWLGDRVGLLSHTQGVKDWSNGAPQTAGDENEFLQVMEEQRSEHLPVIDDAHTHVIFGRPVWEYAAKVPPNAPGATSGQWSYDLTQPTGPHGWASVSPAYERCGQDHGQSPIDLRDEEVLPDLQPLRPHSESFPLAAFHDAHTIVVPYPQDLMSEFTMDDRVFRLDHIEFHRPSEHIFCTQGKGDLELHFVWTSVPTLQFPFRFTAIIAVWFKHFENAKGRNKDSDNPFLAAFSDALPTLSDLKDMRSVHHYNRTVPSLEMLFPKDNFYNFFAYEGSLTSAPCTENVKWLVKREGFDMSAKQLDFFTKSIPKANARGLKPAGHERLIRLFTKDGKRPS